MQLIKQTQTQKQKRPDSWASESKMLSQDDKSLVETMLTQMHRAKTLQDVCSASTSHAAGGKKKDLKVFLLRITDQYANKRWENICPAGMRLRICSCVLQSCASRHQGRNLDEGDEESRCLNFFFFLFPRGVAAWALSRSSLLAITEPCYCT